MNELIQKLRKRLRISSESFDDEINDLISACKQDLEVSGIYGSEKDPLYFQAIVLYVKTYFGSNDESEKFSRAYESLKIAMSLSGDFKDGQK